MAASDANDKEFSIYQQRDKVASRYYKDKEGTVVKQRVEDTWATLIYLEKELTNKTSLILEKFSKNLPHNMKCIPMGIKYSDPGLFGRLISNIYSASMKMKNIAICCISPIIMDFENYLADSWLLQLGKSLLE